MSKPQNEDQGAPLNPKAQRCTGKSKRSGKRCKNLAVKGRKTCRMHNGHAKRGPNHHAYRHGRLSKMLGDERGRILLHALEDPEVASFRTVIGLLNVRIDDLVQAAYGTDGTGGLSVKTIRERWTELEEARESGDRPRFADAFDAMREAIDGATAAEDAWIELAEVLDKKRRTAAAMQLAEVRSDRAISAERFDFLLTFILDSVTRHVQNLEGGHRAIGAVAKDIDPIFSGVGAGEA